MVKAVLWDFGGVLTSSPFEAFNRYEAEHGLPANFLRRVNATNPHDNAWAHFERSDVTVDEFDDLFHAESAALGHPVPGADVIALLGGDPRPDMIEALRICSENFITACITNNVKTGLGPGMASSGTKAETYAYAMSLFRVVIESSKVGHRKPEPEIYRIACETLNIDPKDAVYLDDLGINLKPARAMGMQTIKVIDPAAAIDELQEIVGIALR